MGPNKENNDEMWKFTRFQLTPDAKRKLLAKGLELAVKVMYNTHLYTFGGKVYHQQSGAPIGERGSVGTCRIILNFGGKVYHQQSGAPIGERGSVGTCRIILNFVDREVQEKLVTIKNALPPRLPVPR